MSNIELKDKNSNLKISEIEKQDCIDLFENPYLNTVNPEMLKTIKDRLPEFHRVKLIIGHSTSQTSYSLQTMNMISDSPYSRLKQCMAQISKKLAALRESHFKMERLKLYIADLKTKSGKSYEIALADKETEAMMIQTSMENSIREIGMFQDMYDQIKLNNNIPDNWSEKDYEQSEIENMIRSSFRIAIQDVSNYDRVSRAAVEYWEQLGIHPQVGTKYVFEYMRQVNEMIESGGEVTIVNMYNFLDKMVERFKDEYKIALKRMGLNEIGSERFMAEGQTKPR